MADAIDDELLADLYGWVDLIPLTRPKKDIKRDFADGGRSFYLISSYTLNELSCITNVMTFCQIFRNEKIGDLDHNAAL